MEKKIEWIKHKNLVYFRGLRNFFRLINVTEIYFNSFIILSVARYILT